MHHVIASVAKEFESKHQKYPEHAPEHYSGTEASAWADGYSAGATQAFTLMDSLIVETPDMDNEVEALEARLAELKALQAVVTETEAAQARDMEQKQ